MTSRSLCGRADLVRVLAKDDPALFEAFANGLGYELKPSSAPKTHGGEPDPTLGGSGISDPVHVEPPELEEQPLSEVPLWRAFHHEAVFLAPEEPDLVMEERPVWHRTNLKEEPRIRLLSPWSDLNTRLRQALNLDAEGSEPDIDRTIEQICEGTFLEQLPRLSRRRWPSGLQVIIDRSERLVPFWYDQDQVMGELARLSSSLPLEQSIFHEGVTRPKVRTGPEAGEPFAPRPDGIALVLGDLGCLKSFENPDVRPWVELGEQLRAAGCRPVALVPCPIWRIPAKLRRI